MALFGICLKDMAGAEQGKACKEGCKEVRGLRPMECGKRRTLATSASIAGWHMQILSLDSWLVVVGHDLVRNLVDSPLPPLQELLENFDVDFDFPKQRIRFFRPGEGIGEAAAAGLVDIPAAVLNETGILGIRVTSPEAAARGGQVCACAGQSQARKGGMPGYSAPAGHAARRVASVSYE